MSLGIRRFQSVADYFTVNISSPNTPGLRDLQARESLAALLSAVLAAGDEGATATGKRRPVFLKIAPDLTEESMDDIAAEALAHDLDGLIVSNTTLSREGLADPRLAGEAGGLSGRPLFEKSTAVLARMRKRVGARLPIIGVGGGFVGRGRRWKRSAAGADLGAALFLHGLRRSGSSRQHRPRSLSPYGPGEGELHLGPARQQARSVAGGKGPEQAYAAGSQQASGRAAPERC